MRKFGMLLASGFVILMSVAWVEGQQGGDKKKGGFGGGGFGGFGQGGQQSPLNLLNRADVKKELDITDEQTEKLPAEVLAAIGKVLNEKQMKRFKQIELQQRGNNALKDKAVQKTLKITSEQATSIDSIIEDSRKELAELFKGGGFGKGGGEKLETARKETKEKLFTVLTKDQRKAWRDMIGEDFKMERPTFGGFGGKGKDTKKETPKDN